jgi:hypothetical protein
MSFYTHLDLASGFSQYRVREEDVHKTAFQTHDGLIMEWLAMPFGMCDAPATFQRMMIAILRDFLPQFVSLYLDDVWVYIRTMEENVRAMLLRCKEGGLKLRLKKCFRSSSY